MVLKSHRQRFTVKAQIMAFELSVMRRACQSIAKEPSGLI